MYFSVGFFSDWVAILVFGVADIYGNSNAVQCFVVGETDEALSVISPAYAQLGCVGRSCEREQAPDSSSNAVSLGMSFAHVYDVAVSLSVSIFCLSRSMTSVAKCWPKAFGGVTDDIGGFMCF